MQLPIKLGVFRLYSSALRKIARYSNARMLGLEMGSEMESIVPRSWELEGLNMVDAMRRCLSLCVEWVPLHLLIQKSFCIILNVSEIIGTSP